MPDTLPPRTRRWLVGVMAGVPCLGVASSAAGAARPTPDIAARPLTVERFPRNITLLSAGPDHGRMDRWSEVLAAPLERALPAGSSLQVTAVGGIDGVTAANRFEARVAPDGGTALLVPGSAALAWLAGDPRARFDAARWVSVLVGFAPAVLVARRGLPPLVRGSRVRIGSAGAVGADMPALLALDLLGVDIAPMTALADPFMAREAFAKGAVDVVFLRGPGTPELVARLAGQGAQPLFSLGALNEDGTMTRDPLLPDIPILTELHGMTFPVALFEAWRAAAAATGMEFGLMLPELTPASSIAVWRRAAEQAVATAPVREACAAATVRPMNAPGAATLTKAIAVNANVLLELRQWLSTRFHWQPS